MEKKGKKREEKKLAVTSIHSCSSTWNLLQCIAMPTSWNEFSACWWIMKKVIYFLIHIRESGRKSTIQQRDEDEEQRMDDKTQKKTWNLKFFSMTRWSPVRWECEQGFLESHIPRHHEQESLFVLFFCFSWSKSFVQSLNTRKTFE